MYISIWWPVSFLMMTFCSSHLPLHRSNITSLRKICLTFSFLRSNRPFAPSVHPLYCNLYFYSASLVLTAFIFVIYTDFFVDLNSFANKLLLNAGGPLMQEVAWRAMELSVWWGTGKHNHREMCKVLGKAEAGGVGCGSFRDIGLGKLAREASQETHIQVSTWKGMIYPGKEKKVCRKMCHGVCVCVCKWENSA